MTDHSVKHSTFTLERIYAASPAAVFAAWSDRDTKAKWFADEDGSYSLDFRVGGTEAVHGGDGVDLVARSEYHIKFLRYITDPAGRQTLTVDYFDKGEDYTFINDAGQETSEANLTNPFIIDQDKGCRDSRSAASDRGPGNAN
jgi:hypothetical protein